MQQQNMFLFTPGLQYLDEESTELIEPKYHHTRFKFTKQAKLLSPWITPQYLTPKKSAQLVLFQQTERKHQLKSTPSKDVKYKNTQKSIQVSQFQYKLKNTLVQFRVKSLSKNQHKNSLSPTKQNFLQHNEFNLFSEPSQKKNKSAFALQLEKTPKIKFLQRKFKVKESLRSISRRKQSDYLQRGEKSRSMNRTVYANGSQELIYYATIQKKNQRSSQKSRNQFQIQDQDA